MRQIRQGKAIELSGISIIPVECIVIDGNYSPTGLTVTAEYTPLGIIFDNGSKRWAIGIDGNPVALEDLKV